MDLMAVEVLQRLLLATAEEMGITLIRAAYSPNIKERRDASCAVFDAEGRVIAQAAHIPMHLSSMVTCRARSPLPIRDRRCGPAAFSSRTVPTPPPALT